MQEACIIQARQGSTCVFAFIGEIRYPLAPAFSEHLDKMFRVADFDDVLIDLSAATSIDSTCLGLLAKVANFMRERFERMPVLISTRADISELLESLGFDQVFSIRHAPRSPLEGALAIPSIASLAEHELAWTVLDAHHVLSGLNEANRLRFEDVIDSIQGELAGGIGKARS